MVILDLFKSVLKSNKTQNKDFRNFILNSETVWHFSTPKSASTFLSKIFIESEKFQTFACTQHHGNKRHVFSSDFSSRQIDFDTNKPLFSVHSHMLCDKDFELYVNPAKHKIIVQTRNIFETIESLMEMHKKYNQFENNPFVISKGDESNLLDKYIYSYTPFHVNFILSWLNYKDKLNSNISFITYKSFINDPKFFVKKIYPSIKNVDNIISGFTNEEIRLVKGNRKTNFKQSKEKEILRIVKNLLCKSRFEKEALELIF